MAAGHIALIGLVLVLLPACSTCDGRRASAPPAPRSAPAPDAGAEVILTPTAGGSGEVRRVADGFEVDLTITLEGPQRGIVLLWAGDFEGRPPRDQPATFDTRAPVGFPWRPGAQLHVPARALADGSLDLYLLVIVATETGVYEVCEDRVAVPIPEDAARVPFDLDPRPLRWPQYWEDLRVNAPLPESR